MSATATYQMPEPKLGDFINYYAHEESPANIGIVTEIGNRTIKCWCMVPDFGGIEKFSVHHREDPSLDEYPEWKKYGVWDFKPADPQITMLCEKVALLEKKVAEIGGKRGK